MKYVPVLALLMALARPATAGGPPDKKLDAATRKQVVDAAVKALDQYVFPETAAKMTAAMRARLADRSYDPITSARAFAERLTADLQAISHDKHLRVHFFAEKLPATLGRKEPDAAQEAAERRFAAEQNHGVERVERLPGNVGYLDLRAFMPEPLAGETLAAAMTLVADTDALLIDLRQNGGGDPATVALISSYLFGAEPVHLNDLYQRATDTTAQFWTRGWVPGKRFGPDKPVWVLTSARTFSAAEELSYNLQNLKRATIVGETTGGGANPGDRVRLTDHFGMFVPTGRAVNPITKTNWEGVGVVPDVKVAADAALDTAYLAALEKVVAAEKDKRRKALLTELLEETRAKQRR